MTVVASSGDAGPFNTIGSPASTPGVISAGASTMFRSYAQTGSFGFQLSNGRYRGDSISGLSSSGVTQPGRTIDLVAPGDLGWALCTPDTDQFVGCSDLKGAPAGLQQFGGTSEAAPLTAGAAALVIQAYRDSHWGASPAPDLVRRLLTSTADDLGLPATEQGAGLLDSLRAVRAARSAPGPRGTGAASDELLAGPQQLDLTATGGAATGQETVTNLSDRARVVHAAVRSSDVLLASANQDVDLETATGPRFVDQFGSTRAYASTTFTVPRGATRVVASIAWNNPNTLVRIVLLEPDGTYAGFSQPQGLSDFGTVDVPNPVPGRWTAAVYTIASPGGFSGAVHLSAASFGTGSGGSANPADFVLGAHQSRTIAVSARSTHTPGDQARSLVLSSGGVSATVPVVVRDLVQLRGGRATVTGSFAGGNGRAGIPNPAQTYAVDVPAGARDLSVGLSVTGDPGQQLYGFLVDPSGEAVSVRTNQRPDGSLVGGLQLRAATPRPGRWHFVFMVFGPVSGNALSTPYTASFALDAARAGVTGLPASPRTTLRAGRPVTATVSFTNTGVTDGAFFVDGRLDTRGSLPLVVDNADYTATGAAVGPFPIVRVPTQSDSLSLSARADQDISFDASPISADHLGDLGVGGDPDREAGPFGRSPSVTIADPALASMPRVALPDQPGPFADTSPTVHASFTGTVHTRLFDPAVTASTGDPLLSYVDSTAPASSPVGVAAGAHGTVSVTITPSGARGTVVRGVLYLDTVDALTGSTDEVAAIPYAYTVG